MTALVWDKPGEKFYQTGIEHGVLYLHDGRSAAWNGLTGVEQGVSSDLKSFYLDGVKFLEKMSPGEFSGKLKAWTYPDEFDEVLGNVEVAPGLLYHEQPPKSFDLSFKTKIANDLDSDLGYKIHLLYNLLADPDANTYNTLKREGASPIEFSWSLTATPPKIGEYRPTSYITIDSTKTGAEILQPIEDILYGTDTQDPRMPSIDEVKYLYNALGVLLIVDNGDGTWTAIDLADDYISMINSTTFQIDNADVTYLDATTYTISTTDPNA